MNIGLYFGSFNPIHVGHLIIANHLVEHSNLDQVWMMVTPHSPMKQKNSLLDDYKRLELVQMAVENYPKIIVSNFEFKLPQPNFTINTLAHLQDKYPNDDFSLIMGEDNLKSLHKWKNYQTILENHYIFVYPRLVTDVGDMPLFLEHKNTKGIYKINAPIVEISSTFIRESIKNKKNVMPLLPYNVWKYIEHNNLYS